MRAGVMRVRVGIATFRRNDGLAAALAGLAAQRLPPAAAEVSVVVVDNNPDGRAHALVAATAAGFPWPLAYVHETRPGLSPARNAALAAAADADFLAFLDDDEVPSPDWLAQLLAVQAARDADVVTGPTLPRYERPPPDWLREGRFLEPRRWPDGAAVETAFTGNVLVRMAAVRRAGARFDERLSFIGGEDIHFFDRLRRAGARLHWADGAVVRESVPPSRATLRWLLRRWMRTGGSDAFVYMDSHPGLGGRLGAAARGALRLAAGGAVLAGVALVGGMGRRHRVVARLYTPARGLGMLAVALGHAVREYAAPAE